MRYISNQQYKPIFTGIFRCDPKLEGKLNNTEDLNNLADVSNVDTISTNMSDNRRFFPRDNLYTTVSSKKIGDKTHYGVDVILLSKDASKENVSKNIFESAQKSLGKLMGNIVKQQKRVGRLR